MYAILALLFLATIATAQNPSSGLTYSGPGFGASYLGVQQRPQASVVQLTNYQQNQGQTGQQQTITAIDASRAQIAAAIAQGANPNNFAVQTNARYTIANQPNVQSPDPFTALDALRGRNQLTIDEIVNILTVSVPGRDYPVYNDIPSTRFTCENVKQAGFYADPEAQCQVIRRCDINGVLWSYLCPNMTLFNQITLVCDWFFNVNCNNAARYYDYSNPRLYTQFVLLDTPNQPNRPVVTGSTGTTTNTLYPTGRSDFIDPGFTGTGSNPYIENLFRPRRTFIPMRLYF